MTVKNRVIYGGIIAASTVLSGVIAVVGARDAVGQPTAQGSIALLGGLYGAINGVAAAACTLVCSAIMSTAISVPVSMASKLADEISKKHTPYASFKETFRTCFKLSSAVIGTTIVAYNSVSAYHATNHHSRNAQQSSNIMETAPSNQTQESQPMQGNLARTQIASANFSIEGKLPVRPLDAQHLAAARLRMGRA